MVEQTKTRPQKNLEFKMIKQMQTFSFNPPINLAEEGKWLLAVTFSETTNSVFNITNGNNSFSITIPGHCESKDAEKTFDELIELLELRSLELHVKEVRKSGIKIKIGDIENNLSDFDTKKTRYLKNEKKNNIQRY